MHKISLNYEPSTPTSRYRHDALLCVHQVGLVPLHLSSIQATPAPGVRSSRLLSPVQLPPPFARLYRRVSLSYFPLRLLFLLQVSFLASSRGGGGAFSLSFFPAEGPGMSFALFHAFGCCVLFCSP